MRKVCLNSKSIPVAAGYFLIVSLFVLFLSFPARTIDAQTALSANIDDYSQCANDQGIGYATGDTGCRWINGNLQHNNSNYMEGDATVQRLAIMDLTAGDHTVTVSYGTTKAGKHAYDFLTDDRFSESWITDADLCDPPLTHFANCAITPPVDSGLIPLDPNAAGHDGATPNRHFKIRNGSWVGTGIVSGPILVSGTYAGDSETRIQLQFHVDAGTCTNAYNVQGIPTCEVLITFGAHVASTPDWAPQLTVKDISGSPYHVAVVELDGSSIGQRDNQMQAYQTYPSPSPGVCDAGCTWINDFICNVGTCLGTCIRRTAYCRSNIDPGVNCLPDQCAQVTDTTCDPSCAPTEPSPSPGEPTPSPQPIAQCTAVKFYGVSGDPNVATNWQLLTLSQLAALQPGDIIYVTTLGSVANGPTITQARIRSTTGNDTPLAFTLSNATTSVMPGSSPAEYYIVYTIPQFVPNPPVFNFDAEVYSPQFDTNTDPWDSGLGWR